MFTSPSNIIMVGIKVFYVTKSSKKRTRGKYIVTEKICNLEMVFYKKQKRQDWDHKAYHDAPSAIYCAVAQ